MEDALEANRSSEVVALVGEPSLDVGKLEHSTHGHDSATSQRWKATPWGAIGYDVLLEPEATKAKKNGNVDACRGNVPSSRVRAVPLSCAPPAGGATKYVHFMRHGEGTSNNAARLNGKEEYKSHQWKDARLTQRGREQALDVGAFVAQSGIKVEALLVSPLPARR